MNEEVSREEYTKLIEYMVLAFEELHSVVLAKAGERRYIAPLSDYPTMAFRDNGFPYFTKQGTYREGGRLDYLGTIRPSGLRALMIATRDDKLELPQSDALEEFVKGSSFAHHFQTSGEFNGYRLQRMIDGAVERYLQSYGLGPVENNRRVAVLRPLYNAITSETLQLRVMVPIALTGFDFDHFAINESTYVTRIPRGIQLSRSRNRGFHSGASDGALEAATHALVSANWSIEPDNLNALEYGLGGPGQNVLEMVDLFFASLRAATGISTGYAQVLMVPQGWATGFYADLPQVFGSSLRRYPNSFDADYYKPGLSIVRLNEMSQVKRIYNLIVSLENDRVSIALQRLNACMTRDDAVDAILDATIGLEVLLGKGAEAISYKIRMRAAALASLRTDQKPEDVFRQVKAIYDFRSKVVHGDTSGKRKGKKLNQDDDSRFREQ